MASGFHATKRGNTYIEVLIAVLICAVAIGGLMSIWGVSLKQVQEEHELTLAGELARADLEKAKDVTWRYFPIPSGLVPTNYTQDGATVKAVSWDTATSPTYYDTTGATQANGAAVNLKRLKLYRQLTARDVLVDSSGSAVTGLGDASRIYITTVVQQQTSPSPLVYQTIFTSTTILTRGGV